MFGQSKQQENRGARMIMIHKHSKGKRHYNIPLQTTATKMPLPPPTHQRKEVAVITDIVMHSKNLLVTRKVTISKMTVAVVCPIGV